MNDDQKFFEDCRTMFITDGWKHFQQEVQTGIQSLNLGALNTAEEFWKAKGRWEALLQIAGWENAVLAAEQQTDEAAQDA